MLIKILYAISHVLYLIAWCISSSISEAAGDLCLEPEEDEYSYIDDVEVEANFDDPTH